MTTSCANSAASRSSSTPRAPNCSTARRWSTRTPCRVPDSTSRTPTRLARAVAATPSARAGSWPSRSVRTPTGVVPVTSSSSPGSWAVVPGGDQPTMVEGGAPEQLRQALVNARAVLAEAGATFDQVVKATLFLTDMGVFAACNEVWIEAFEPPRPTRSAVAVAPTAARRARRSRALGLRAARLRRSTRSATCRTCNRPSAPFGSGGRAPHPTSREVVARARRPCAPRRSTRSPRPG